MDMMHKQNAVVLFLNKERSVVADFNRRRRNIYGEATINENNL